MEVGTQIIEPFKTNYRVLGMENFPSRGKDLRLWRANLGFPMIFDMLGDHRASIITSYYSTTHFRA